MPKNYTNPHFTKGDKKNFTFTDIYYTNSNTKILIYISDFPSAVNTYIYLILCRVKTVKDKTLACKRSSRLVLGGSCTFSDLSNLGLAVCCSCLDDGLKGFFKPPLLAVVFKGNFDFLGFDLSESVFVPGIHFLFFDSLPRWFFAAIVETLSLQYSNLDWVFFWFSLRLQ